jgi:putative endonuclease
MKTYYVYILTTKNNQLLYIGVTNNLERRLYEHKNNLVEWYTSKYNIHKLVYYESCGSIVDAIAREKQLKGMVEKEEEWTNKFIQS